jgi:SnoaL-like domain
VPSLAGEPAVIPRPDGVRIFFDSLAAQDFPRLASAFSDDAHLRALLPGEFREWDGAERVAATFKRWFGNTEEYEFVDATVDVVGARLHLRWRAHLRAERLGDGWFVVDQEAYIDTDADDRICELSLLCSGYLPDRDEA